VRGWKPNARRRVKNLCSLENRHDPDALATPISLLLWDIETIRKIKCMALVPDVFIARPVCFLSAAGRLLGCLRARKILAVEEPKVRCVEFACLRTHSRDVCFSNLSKYVRAPIHYEAEHQHTLIGSLLLLLLLRSSLTN
jgi:hypothetical protein